MKLTGFSFLMLLYLAGCAVPQQSPVDQLAALNAQATLAVVNAQATETAGRAMAATLAVVNAQATRVAGATATLEAFYGEVTRQAVVAQATAEAQAVGATATRLVEVQALTATEEARVTGATLNAQAAEDAINATLSAAMVNAQATRMSQDAELRALQVARQATWNKVWPVLVWLGVLAALAVLGVGLGYWWRAGRPVVILSNDRHLVRSDYAMLPPVPAASPKALPVPAQPALLPPPAGMPEIVHLPMRLPAGQIGLGATPSRELWFRQGELGDIMGAGIKGSGKSTALRMLAYQAKQQGWGLYLADAETLTFDPAVWGEVASDPAQFEALLDRIMGEFERRFDLFRESFRLLRERVPAGQQFFVEDLAAYNRAAGMLGLEVLPPMMLVVDEANNFVGAGRAVDTKLHEILRRNRKPGLTVALFAHTWHSKQVAPGIFNNLTRRIVWRCSDRTSRVVLGEPVGETIAQNTPGVAIMGDESGRVGRFKTFYVSAERLLAADLMDSGVVIEQPPAVTVARPELSLAGAVDGQALDNAPQDQLRSLNGVARWLTGKGSNANRNEIERAAEALRFRVEEMSCQWAAQILEKSRSQFAQ